MASFLEVLCRDGGFLPASALAVRGFWVRTPLSCPGLSRPMCHSCMASCSAVCSEGAKYFSWMPRVLRGGVLRFRHSRRWGDWPGQELPSFEDHHPHTPPLPQPPQVGVSRPLQPSLGGSSFFPTLSTPKVHRALALQLVWQLLKSHFLMCKVT